MNKYELLRTIGFSKEYISHIKDFEENETYVFETVKDDYVQQTNDLSEMVINESINNFSTKLVIHRE